MDSIITDVSREFINLIYKEFKKNRNKKKISYIIDTINKLIMNSINPYLYTIMGILLVIFIMNCVQFYYYLKINKHILSVYNLNTTD